MLELRAMKFYLSLVLIFGLGIVVSIHGQHEMSIEDMDNDGDAVLELLKQNTKQHLERHMIIGVNQSSEGFLRMVSDHDLSLWTDNKRRLTINNGGFVGIGTHPAQARLHVAGGDIIAQTQLRIIGNLGIHEGRFSFYSEDFLQGSLISRGSNIILERAGLGGLILRTNDNDRLRIGSSGLVTIPDLAGSGQSIVVVDESGNLKRIEAEAQEIHMQIPVNHFQAMFGTTMHNEFGRIWAPPQLFQQNLVGMYWKPIFHHNKVLIKSISIDYIDDDSASMTFRINHNGQSTELFSTNDSSSRTFEDLNIEIDQREDILFHVIVFNARKRELSITGGKIVYQVLE